MREGERERERVGGPKQREIKKKKAFVMASFAFSHIPKRYAFFFCLPLNAWRYSNEESERPKADISISVPNPCTISRDGYS